MSPLIITVFRLGYLALLWLLILAVTRAVRRDVFGATIKEKRPRPGSTANNNAGFVGATGVSSGALGNATLNSGSAAATSGALGLGAGLNKAKNDSGLSRGALFGGRSRSQNTINRPHYPRLIVTSGPLTGASLELTGGAITFGRAPNCSLVLDDEYASSMHAKIYERDGLIILADMGSTNGTFVDGVPVENEVALKIGQNIQIGKTVIELSR